MSTNNYPGIGFRTQGFDYNFFKKVSVTATSFGSDSVDGYQPTLIINLPVQAQTIMFLNLGSGVVEYSFNGTTVHGELNSANSTVGLTFENRVISTIWFRIQTGSSGPITVSVQAWSTK